MLERHPNRGSASLAETQYLLGTLSHPRRVFDGGVVYRCEERYMVTSRKPGDKQLARSRQQLGVVYGLVGSAHQKEWMTAAFVCLRLPVQP